MQWEPTGKERRSMRRRESAAKFRQWLDDNRGFVPASWAHHLTGVSKSTISRAQHLGRVRAERFTFPDGRVLTLISLQDALRLDVYRRVPGITDQLGDDAPPGLKARQRRSTGR